MPRIRQPDPQTQSFGLNAPGFLYLNEHVLAQVRNATGDEGKGTIDELKFSPLYDRVSELLFPWCSTLTTRARYFFFSFAVLKLALNRAVPPHAVNHGLDPKESRAHAERRLTEFLRQVRRIEKYLTLALVTKGGQDGIFGRIRVTRWLRDANQPLGAKPYERSLTLDSRYPNAIYRASCRRLGLFSLPSQNTTMLAARFVGQDPFDSNWTTAGKQALVELERIVNFFEQYENKQAINLKSVVAEFKLSTAFRKFSGFTLDDTEAAFLFEQIQASTPYWGHVKPAQLNALFSGEVGLSTLANVFAQVPEKAYFEVAHHIDVVTRYFRDFYEEIIRHPGETPSIRPLRQVMSKIEQSANWLDRHATDIGTESTGWKALWTSSYADLIRNWIVVAKKRSAQHLAEELKARAEEVVSMRGGSKLPPHRRPPEEDSIRVELDAQPSSFRLRNATLILQDIARGLPNG